MKTICLLVSSLFASVFFFACKKEKEKDPITISCNKRTSKLEEVKQLIVGQYDWAYTEEIKWRIGTYIHTPASTGTTNRYVFDRQGNVRYYENQQLMWDRRYEVDYELRVSQNYLDSAAIVIIKDKTSGERKEDFRAYLCNDSALFYDPRFISEIDRFRNYKRQRY